MLLLLPDWAVSVFFSGCEVRQNPVGIKQIAKFIRRQSMYKTDQEADGIVITFASIWS